MEARFSVTSRPGDQPLHQILAVAGVIGHSGSGGGAVPTMRGVAVADEFAGASVLIVARSPTPPPVTPDMGISAIRRCQPTQRVGLWGGCSPGPAAP
jgi:hypothetical protein